jgi:hypothetical protein
MSPRSFGRSLVAAFRVASAVLLLGGVATGCGRVADVVSPGRAGLAPARLALAARLPALAQVGTAALRIGAAYDRAGGAPTSLGTQTLTLGDARTQDVPVSIDLSACLNDPQRLRPEGAPAAACSVRLTVTLLLDERVVDEQTVGPLLLVPGTTTAVPAAVTLFDVRTVRVDPPSGAVVRPDGAVRLEVGAALALAAVALDPAGQPLAARAPTWTSETPAVATVNATTGVVTAVAPGTTRITASVGGRSATVVVAVVPRTQPLTVALAGSGAGAVVSTPAGIDCRLVGGQPQGTCSFAFPGDAQVSLLATPQQGAGFAGWGDACAAAGTATTCVVTSDQARTVRATFGALRTVSVTGGGTGSGTVTSTPAGIACTLAETPTGSCSGTFVDGAAVTLAAAPAANSVFAGWTGACSGTGACTVTVDQARTVGATFTRRQVALVVTLSGAGAGTIGVAGQQCALAAGAGSASCTLRVDVERPLTLSAQPAAGSEFTGWSGACAASARAPTCTLTPTADAAVGAAFAPATARLTIVSDAGATGLGGVRSSDGALACTLRGAVATGTCATTVAAGTTLTLDAVPDQFSNLAAWTGGCAGTTGLRCTLVVRDSAVVGLRFERRQAAVTVNLTGAGAGAVTLDGAALCTLAPNQGTASCTRQVDLGTSITLALQPAAGAAATWGGPCANAPPSGPCTVTVTSTPVTVPVTFAPGPQTLAVRPLAAYRGGGTIATSDRRIACTVAFPSRAVSGTCEATYPVGTTVALSFTPAANSGTSIVEWVGPCAPATSSGCTVVVPSGGATVQPGLALRDTLVIATTGAGGVTVTGGELATPFVCSDGTCRTLVREGTTITLTTSPTAAGGFRQWTGLCTGATSPCTVRVPPGASTPSVGAAFDEAVRVSLNGSGLGTVTVQGIGAPNNVCTRTRTDSTTTCILRALAPTTTLVATAPAGSVFRGWDAPGCTTAATCVIDVRQPVSVFATFSAVVSAVPSGSGGAARDTARPP